MPPRKAALKRQQAAPPPARFGIQHFFSKHAANSQAVRHQTAPPAPVGASYAVVGHSGNRNGGAADVPQPVGTAHPAGFEQNAAEVRGDDRERGAGTEHLQLQAAAREGGEWAVAKQCDAPPFDRAGFVSPGVPEATNGRVAVPGPGIAQEMPNVAATEKVLKDFPASNVMPPPAAEEDHQARQDSRPAAERRKRPRYSPEMVIMQSQDDGGDEVVWRVSPTSDRLLAAAANQPTALMGGERPALRPCNIAGNTGALQDFLIKATSIAARSGASPKKKSPGIAGKLETWLSSSKPADDGAPAASKFSHAGNKENIPSACPAEGVEKHLKESNAKERRRARRRSSFVSLDRPLKTGTKKQAQSGHRRKALLDLLEQVKDAIVVEEGQPECTLEHDAGKNSLALKATSEQEKATSEQKRSTSADCCEQSKEVVTRHSLRPCDRAHIDSGDGSGVSKGSGSENQVVLAVEGFIPSAGVECLATDCATLCLSIDKPSGSKEESRRDEVFLATTAEQSRNCVDVTDHIAKSAYPDLELAELSDTAEDDWQASTHFIVLEVAEGEFQEEGQGLSDQQKVLRLLQEGSGMERVVYLRDAWFYSTVKPGDTVNVIGDLQEDGSCVVDALNHLIIVHPDILVSGSRVGASFSCPRRSVLDERIKSTDVSIAALMGTMLHQLFQVALLSRTPSRGLLESEAQAIVLRHIDGLYAANGSQKEAYKQLMDAIPIILGWVRGHLVQKLSGDFNVDNSQDKAPCVNEVVDIEETIWSPMYGLKGMIDASLMVRGRASAGSQARVLPWELKTGKGTTGMAAMEHRAQVFLYTLLMSDRYKEEVKDGMLYYMHTQETQELQVQRADIVGLMIRRNEHANSLLSASTTQLLPPMLKGSHMCRGCRHLDVCNVYHKVNEGGSPESSGLGDLFHDLTDHLSTRHAEFLQQWDRLIDLEAQDMQVSHREIWRMSSKKRELHGRCLSSLIIDMTSGQPETQHAKTDKYTYCFRRTNWPDRQGVGLNTTGSFLDRPFSSGDFVILSTESGHTAVAAGVITSISKDSLQLSLSRRLRIPSKPGMLDADRLSQEVWRIDKDETASSVALMRYNLLQLFIKQAGNENHRQLIVDLEAPRFESGALSSQDPASLYVRCASGLNDDQRKAIHKILAARDYALVLGMPGTGKTSLIVHAVKALLTRGCSILLTSYTNSAVDNILLKLKAEGVDFTRVGRNEAIHPELRNHALSGADGLVTSVEELHAKVQRAQVVGATCLGITHALFSKRRFDVCIVDEAGQITLPVCLGPLHCASKFVLVGDHYQLPPLVRNSEAREKGMAISLFRRLSEAQPQSVYALQSQYRMCADIMALSNALIYGNRLRCGSAEVASAQLNLLKNYADNCHPWLAEVLDPARRVLFLDTDALSAEETRMRKAVHNVGESSLVVKVTKGLISAGISIQDIGVISPYNAQVDTIRRMASEAGLTSLEVHTVDKYQGRDKECIVVSFVRSHASCGGANPGSLLADWHRINVAITRAKKKLIMLGSQRTLSSTPLLSLLIRQVRHLGGLVELPPGIP